MKKYTRPIWLIIVLALLSLALYACSATSKAAQFPTGKFVNSGNDIYTYEFKPDNTWSYYTGGLMAAKGTYKIDGDTWIEQGTPECPYTGSYTWTYDGKNLTFKLKDSDGCSPRKEATDGQTFTLLQ